MPSPSTPSVAPLSGCAYPAPREIPEFKPLRVGRRFGWPPGSGRHRRQAVAAALGAAAIGLACAAFGAEEPSKPPHPTGPAPAVTMAGRPGAPPAAAPPPRAEATRLVSAPVRIADAATVRLLRPGDRVDVVAVDSSPAQQPSRPRVLATAAQVTEVPGPEEGLAEGALVVLSVPRGTAQRLVGAATVSRLAVSLC
ncbi:hypothetical protein [Streptomyces sp. NPDC006879]|uniref:hypothetical protein n=1 Tax=Streptomyces sp. NPDC006879 TaxID=3364767 RepID=UPI0036AB7C40